LKHPVKAAFSALLLLAGCSNTTLVRTDCASVPVAERERCLHNVESSKAIVAERAKADGDDSKPPGEFGKKDLEAARSE
jgi:outer membrane murein-binding lipoprotein Lpp